MAGECLTKTRLGVKNIYTQITEIDAQLVSRAGFLKERTRKTELGLNSQISDKMLLLIMSTSLLLVRMLSIRVAE